MLSSHIRLKFDPQLCMQSRCDSAERLHRVPIVIRILDPADLDDNGPPISPSRIIKTPHMARIGKIT